MDKAAEGCCFWLLKQGHSFLIQKSEWLGWSTLADMQKDIKFWRKYGILPNEDLEDCNKRTHIIYNMTWKMFRNVSSFVGGKEFCGKWN